MAYKFGFRNEDFQIETDLDDAIDLLDSGEIKQLLDEATNANQFAHKLNEAIGRKFYSYIRHDPGLEMDDEMNTEVLGLARKSYERRAEKTTF
jgi:CRISPR/Cas system CSM-associated protein Csm2 small subunit